MLIDLVPTDADDLDSRRLLAQMLSKSGRHAEAQRYAREATGDRRSRYRLQANSGAVAAGPEQRSRKRMNCDEYA